MRTSPQLKPWLSRAWGALLIGTMTLFILNIGLMVAAVTANSFARRWLGTWLPEGYTAGWYVAAWKEFQLDAVLWVTVEVVLARKDFHGKKLVTLLFLLPLIIPPITYGIPFATVMYTINLAGTLPGVILANLVPALPFMILVMTPFIEQIDPTLESAARVFGAGTARIFWHVLAPLLLPGILAGSLLVLVRTIAMFELTFLTAGPDSQTLVVALYYAVFAAGVRAPQSVDAMAIVYMVVTLIWLLIALRFVNPTQLVSRVREHPQPAG